MPHVDDLATALKNKLQKEIVGPWITEMILDPDGENIDLSDYIARSASIKINKKKSIRPGVYGKYSINELRIKVVNENDYFNHNLKGEKFYHATARLYANVLSTSTTPDVHKGDGAKFEAGKKIIISDGENSVTKTISSIDTTTYTLYDRITLTAQLGAAFSSGALIETYYMTDREVTLKTKFDGVADKINQFSGVLKSLPQLSAGEACLTLYDNFKKILDIDLKANDYRILTDSIGGYTNTLEYDREDASDGELDLSLITIDDTKCKIGEWKVEFTSESEDFTIYDPDNIEYTGDTSTVFYAGDSGDYQITIPTAAWSGSFDWKDEITFKTVCSLGTPVNDFDTIPKMLYRLLIEDFGADYTSADIDVTSFTDLINDYDEMRGAISFKRSTTVLKAIELLGGHINGTLFHDNDGKLTLFVYRPRLEPATIKTLSPDADIMEVEQEDAGQIQRIIAHYNYDYDSGKYLGRIILPEGADKIGPHIDVYFPAYNSTDYGQAKATAERIYMIWRRGVKYYKIKEKWNTGLAFDINELYKISSEHPTLAERVVEIYEISKDLLSGNLELMAYEPGFLFGHYAFCDIDYCDRGKVTW